MGSETQGFVSEGEGHSVEVGSEAQGFVLEGGGATFCRGGE